MKSAAFQGPNGSPRMARPGLVEATMAAPWMACAIRRNAGCPVGAADEKRSFSRAERLAKGEGKRLRSAASRAVPSATELCSVAGLARPGIGEAGSVAPGMASTACFSIRSPMGSDRCPKKEILRLRFASRRMTGWGLRFAWNDGVERTHSGHSVLNSAPRERGGERKGPGVSREGIRSPPASDRCPSGEILRLRFASRGMTGWGLRFAQNDGMGASLRVE